VSKPSITNKAEAQNINNQVQRKPSIIDKKLNQIKTQMGSEGSNQAANEIQDLN
jgi:hypothetical protein